MHNIILASTSPRRQQLLEKAGLVFDVVPSDYEEDMALPMPPEELAQHLSRGKAVEVSQKFTNHIIIAADTFIVHSGKIIGKPHTKERAKETLKMMSDSPISIVSGTTVIDTKKNECSSKSTTTIAHVKRLTAREIHAYVETGEPLDCAGAFNISKKDGF